MFVGLLSLRKGRMLMHRVLACLAPNGSTSDQHATVAPPEQIWRLVSGLLRAAPLKQLFHSGEPAWEGEVWDDSHHKLLTSLLRSVEATCSTTASDQGLTESRIKRSSAVLTELAAGGQIEALCARSSGCAVLRQLLQACSGSAAGAPEVIPDSLIDALCAALPKLYGKTRSLRSPSSSRETSQEADRLSQEDLWAMLIALTEQSSTRQKRAIHKQIGPFVSEVNAKS